MEDEPFRLVEAEAQFRDRLHKYWKEKGLMHDSPTLKEDEDEKEDLLPVLKGKKILKKCCFFEKKSSFDDVVTSASFSESPSYIFCSTSSSNSNIELFSKSLEDRSPKLEDRYMDRMSSEVKMCNCSIKEKMERLSSSSLEEEESYQDKKSDASSRESCESRIESDKKVEIEERSQSDTSVSIDSGTKSDLREEENDNEKAFIETETTEALPGQRPQVNIPQLRTFYSERIHLNAVGAESPEDLTDEGDVITESVFTSRHPLAWMAFERPAPRIFPTSLSEEEHLQKAKSTQDILQKDEINIRQRDPSRQYPVIKAGIELGGILFNPKAFWDESKTLEEGSISSGKVVVADTSQIMKNQSQLIEEETSMEVLDFFLNKDKKEDEESQTAVSNQESVASNKSEGMKKGSVILHRVSGVQSSESKEILPQLKSNSKDELSIQLSQNQLEPVQNNSTSSIGKKSK